MPLHHERKERVVLCTVQGISTVCEMKASMPAFWQLVREIDGPMALVVDVRSASAADFGIAQIRWVIAYRRSIRDLVADRWIALAWVVGRDPLALRILLEIQSYDRLAQYTRAFDGVEVAEAWCRERLAVSSGSSSACASIR